MINLSSIRKFTALFFLFAGISVHAQQNAVEKWSVSTKVTPAKCQSDGVVTVVSQNDDALYNFTYLLKENKIGGFSSSLSNSATIKNVPPGTYTLTVNAQLKTDADQKFTRKIDNVEVPGDYKVLDVTYNPSLSRQSYAGCGTGSIILNVINGASNLRFRILEAPAGVTAPADVVATYNPDNGTYKLAGDNYPAGRYVLAVSDRCVERKVDLTIPVYSELPTFTEEDHTIFRAIYSSYYEKDSSKTYSCTSPIAHLQLSPSTRANKQLMHYIENGMFEIGLSPLDRNPRDDQFQPLSKQTYYAYALDMSPTNISDVYSSSNNLKLVVRLKGCPNTTREIPLYIKRPSMKTDISTPYDCGKYTRGYFLWTDYDGLFCYPVTVNLRETYNGPIIQSEVFEGPQNTESKLLLDYDKFYYYEVIDGNGRNLLKGGFSNGGKVDFRNVKSIDCGDKYVSTYKFSSLDNCLPYKVQVINNITQEVVQELTVNDKEYIPTPPLEYNTVYTYKAIKDNQTFTATGKLAKQLSIEKSNPTENKRDMGSLTFNFYGLGAQPHFIVLRQNTKEIAKRENYVAGASNQIYFPSVNLPPGKYQIDVTTEGCPVVTYEFEWKGFYNRENFSYDSQLTCQGLEVTPRGNVTLKQEVTPEKTFFRIISGPKGGYPEEFITPGKNITLTQEGKYKLGIFSEKVYTNYSPGAIDTLDIDFVRKPLQLASQYTAAYACADGTKNGHIVIKAENGVAPYRYELWNKQNTQAIMGSDGKPLKPLETLPNESVHFVHGVAGETYHVKIYDSCGNSFSQPITISDLTYLTIASAAETEVCEGESIRLQSLPLENYQWYLPNAKPTDLPFSTEQNPVITNAKVAHSGLYKLRFNPQFCGKGIEGYVKIVVRPCYVPVNPQLMNRVMLK